LAIQAHLHAHISSELTRTAGVAWQINNPHTVSLAQGARVRLDMKLEIEMRSLILFRFVLEEKKRFVLMEKVKSEVFLTDVCEKTLLSIRGDFQKRFCLRVPDEAGANINSGNKERIDNA